MGSRTGATGHHLGGHENPFTGYALNTTAGITTRITALESGPDGMWLAPAGIDGTVRIGDVDTGHNCTFSPATPAGCRRWRLRPNGTWLASGDEGGVVRIWTPAPGDEQPSSDYGAEYGSVPAAWSSGSRCPRLAARGGGRPSRRVDRVRGKDGRVALWDPTASEERHVLAGHSGAVRAIAVAPGGTWLATAGDDGRA